MLNLHAVVEDVDFMLKEGLQYLIRKEFIDQVVLELGKDLSGVRKRLELRADF